jgi:nitrogen fixation/metabolism regulation signal transduction histidine kinase
VITGKNAKVISGLVPGQYVSLTIEDSGKDRDGETRRKVFEPFITTKFKGHGLGMATAYGIVNNHGGPITVEWQ